MFVALAMSATAATFGSVTSFASATTSAVAYTNGYVVTLTAAGWAYGDAIAPTTVSTTYTNYATLLSNTGLTGVGLMVIGTGTGATTACTAAPTVATTGYTTATLVGNGALGCASDFATLYTATAAGSTSTNFGPYATPAKALVVGTAVRFDIVTPATLAVGTCDGITITAGSNTATTVASAACSANAAVSQASSTSTYAFYVETATAASVCFQTAAQHTASASCGTAITSSSGILSATISGFVAMIALIFFN